MVLRDKFWLWGHPEGYFNKPEDNRVSRMTPMEACLYLGIPNTFMVPLERPISRRQYNKSFTTLHNVGWECYKAAKDPEIIERTIEEAKEFKNISCVVFDDFQRFGEYKTINIDNLYKIHERLKTNEVKPLDMWMVLYTYEYGLDEEKDKDFMRYMAPFDGIIMWTWKESEVPLIPEKFEILKKLSPGQRRMFGCYLWNFAYGKQVSPEGVIWQLDFYREKILAGEAEGVVLHTNTMADLDYPAYAAAIKWMEEHGDEKI